MQGSTHARDPGDPAGAAHRAQRRQAGTARWRSIRPRSDRPARPRCSTCSPPSSRSPRSRWTTSGCLASVTGSDFTVISGHDPIVTLELTFTDNCGEVAIGACLRPRHRGPPAGVSAPAQRFLHSHHGFRRHRHRQRARTGRRLTFPSPRYGVAGMVTPNSGLMTTSIAARVDGQSSSPVASPGLLVQAQADVQGYQVAPLASSWSFETARCCRDWASSRRYRSSRPRTRPEVVRPLPARRRPRDVIDGARRR